MCASGQADILHQNQLKVLLYMLLNDQSTSNQGYEKLTKIQNLHAHMQLIVVGFVMYYCDGHEPGKGFVANDISHKRACMFLSNLLVLASKDLIAVAITFSLLCQALPPFHLAHSDSGSCLSISISLPLKPFL